MVSWLGSVLIFALHSFPTRRSSDLHVQPLPAACSAERGTHLHRVDLPQRDPHPRGESGRAGLQTEPGTGAGPGQGAATSTDRKSTRLNSSHVAISYAVFC